MKTTFRLTSESFQRIITLQKPSNVVINVCDRIFNLDKSILPFISNEINQHFEFSNEPFIINLKESELSNGFYKDVTEERLVESFSIFLDLLNNTNSNNKQISSIDPKLIPSFKLLSQKLYCNDLIQSICRYFEPSALSPILTYEPSNIQIGENEFIFIVDSNEFKCSQNSASMLSLKALKLLCDEGYNRIELQIPPDVDSSDFTNNFNEVFDLLIGKSLEINKNNYLNILGNRLIWPKRIP
jgi:hypothetical protein